MSLLYFYLTANLTIQIHIHNLTTIITAIFKKNDANYSRSIRINSVLVIHSCSL
jgi:hypothetical protein